MLQLRKHHAFAGFALMEVFLALIVIAMITFGSYALIAKYRNAGAIQPLISDLSNIALSYAPIQDSSGLTFTTAVINSDGSISTPFLQGVPIASNHLQAGATTGYSYLLSGLSVNQHGTRVGFAQAQSPATPGSPVVNYFVMGLVVNQNQLSQLIQNLNSTLSVFYGNTPTTPFLQASPVTTLPTCNTGDDCQYAVYLVSPMVDDNTKLTVSTSTNFVAPSLLP